MRSLAFILVLLLGLLVPNRPAVQAQGFGQSLPFLARDASQSEFVWPDASTMYIDLDSRDLTDGVVSAWTNRVSNSIVFTNSASGPYKDGTNGLVFYKTNRLKVDSDFTNFKTNDAFVVLVQNINPSATAWKTVVGANAAERGLMLRPQDWEIYFFAAIPITPNVDSNVWIDIIYTGGVAKKIFTNGVFSTAITPSPAGNFSWGTIGANQAGTVDPWHGYMQKIVWWTNGAAGGLTDDDAVAIHDYLTNTFNYSP